MEHKQVVLQFNPPTEAHGDKKPIRDGLSSLVKAGEYIFLACDEGVSLERLKKGKDGYSEHTCFDLADYIPMKGDKKEEIDIEGIDYENHYLWITGSHGLKRKKPDAEENVNKQIKQLSKVEAEANRYLLARIPLVADPETGEMKLYKSCAHPDNASQELTAARLAGGKKSNQLIDALKKDVHLKNYLKIPGKDNGFDIEGLALDGKRIFLGLRGPVLRGWAAVLEITMKSSSKKKLKLKKVGPKKRRFKKHFLNLSGMGIRELTPAGKDLLILAGPTMDLDGTIALFRWKDALKHTKESKKSIVYEKDIERLFDIPHGSKENSGKDKAEGISLISEHELLVVYDSPVEQRKVNQTDVIADIFPLGGDNKKREIV